VTTEAVALISGPAAIGCADCRFMAASTLGRLIS